MRILSVVKIRRFLFPEFEDHEVNELWEARQASWPILDVSSIQRASLVVLVVFVYFGFLMLGDAPKGWLFVIAGLFAGIEAYYLVLYSLLKKSDGTQEKFGLSKKLFLPVANLMFAYLSLLFATAGVTLIQTTHFGELGDLFFRSALILLIVALVCSVLFAPSIVRFQISSQTDESQENFVQIARVLFPLSIVIAPLFQLADKIFDQELSGAIDVVPTLGATIALGCGIYLMFIAMTLTFKDILATSMGLVD